MTQKLTTGDSASRQQLLRTFTELQYRRKVEILSAVRFGCVVTG